VKDYKAKSDVSVFILWIEICDENIERVFYVYTAFQFQFQFVY
jgi:hypothetical protein